MTAFHKLSEEHAAMDGLAAQLLACVLPQGYDTRRAMALRRRLENVLDAHLAHEQTAMYQDLAVRAVPEVANDNRDLDQELSGLCRDWQGYLSRWGEHTAASDPDGFAAETRTLMLRLRERIALEQQCLAAADVVATDFSSRVRLHAVG